jgi:hypothetical protein
MCGDDVVVVIIIFFDSMQKNKRNQSIIKNSISTLNNDVLSFVGFLSNNKR